MGVLALIAKTSQKGNLIKKSETILREHPQKTERVIGVKIIFKITKAKANSTEDISYLIKKTKKIAISKECYSEKKL